MGLLLNYGERFLVAIYSANGAVLLNLPRLSNLFGFKTVNLMIAMEFMGMIKRKIAKSNGR